MRVRDNSFRESRFRAWLWRTVEAAAVLAVIAWIWVWINSPPGDRGSAGVTSR